MKKILFAFLLLALSSRGVAAEERAPLRFMRAIPLEHVNGRIDHLDADLPGQRLFVAALGNNTLEVIDLKLGKQIRSIAGLREPQGVLYFPDARRLFVTNGEGKSCAVFNADSFQLIQSVPTPEDPDNLRADASGKTVYVGCGSFSYLGTKNGALLLLDAATGKQIGSIPLQGHPESFQIEKFGKNIFVNIPAAHQIAVVNRDQKTVAAKWRMKGATANFPMALDEAGNRLFIGCRSPARLLVLDAEKGKRLALLECVGDADDIFFDAERKRIYVVGGEGRISIFEETNRRRYRPLPDVATAGGARTALFVPEWNQLFVAVPARLGRPAEIRVYETQ